MLVLSFAASMGSANTHVPLPPVMMACKAFPGAANKPEAAGEPGPAGEA